VVCGACSLNGGSGITRSAVAATRPSAPSTGAPGGPIGCLDPPGAVTIPTRGWVPDSTGVSDYEPENAGTQRSPSARTSLLAQRVRTALGEQFNISTVYEFANSTCVVDRDVSLDDGAGAKAFLRVFQLRRPLNDGSFPFVGRSMTRHRLGHGSVLRENHADDDSVVTAVLARADGLVVELPVRSATGQDTSGWPTTMGTSSPSRPPIASPVSVAPAALVVGEMATLAAPRVYARWMGGGTAQSQPLVTSTSGATSAPGLWESTARHKSIFKMSAVSSPICAGDWSKSTMRA
jgi:hypothetical protein